MAFNKLCLVKTKDGEDTEECKKLKDDLEEGLTGINVYDILQDCNKRTNQTDQNFKDSFYFRYARWAFKQFNKVPPSKLNYFMFDEEEDNEALNLTPPCTDDSAIKNYLNINEVKLG